MIEIILISLTRIIEAYRDAEIFQYPVEARSILWHALKFPQFFLWILIGLMYSGRKTMKEGFVYIGIGVLVAWPVFELALWLFREMI